MKVVHICMVAYLDGWGYQDNLLPEYMSKAGHDVVVVSSANHFPSFLKNEEKERILAKGSEYYLNKVHVYRIQTKLDTSNYNFYCSGLGDILKKEKPDVIFHHGVNSSSMLICWKYICSHKNCKFFVDNHADHINESRNKLWNFLVNHLLKLCVKMVQSRVTRFYGVTPGRCSYLNEVYGANNSKIELYPIGFDVDAIRSIDDNKEDLKKKYCIQDDSFVIITGGKMGKDKGTHSLIKAISRLKRHNPEICLLLFGRFTDKETETLAQHTEGIHIEGWCDRQKTLELLKLSDVACWPIHHTTLIEDAVGSCLPIVVRNTPNTLHLIDGNGQFVLTGKEDELYNALSEIIMNYESYKQAAVTMSDRYSYTNLVKQFEDSL